jgi:hypothetical protein
MMNGMTENPGSSPQQLQNFVALERLHKELGANPERTPAQQAVFMILESQIAKQSGNISVQTVCAEIEAAAVAILMVKLEIETASAQQ